MNLGGRLYTGWRGFERSVYIDRQASHEGPATSGKPRARQIPVFVCETLGRRGGRPLLGSADTEVGRFWALKVGRYDLLGALAIPRRTSAEAMKSRAETPTAAVAVQKTFG